MYHHLMCVLVITLFFLEKVRPPPMDYLAGMSPPAAASWVAGSGRKDSTSSAAFPNKEGPAYLLIPILFNIPSCGCR